MKRIISGLVVALGMAAAGNAVAQEILITGPLAGAPAIRKERLYRRGRVELAPTVSFTLLDEYRRTIFTGIRAQYNITEWLSFGVWGAYGAASLQTDLTDQIDHYAPRTAFTVSQVNPGTPANYLGQGGPANLNQGTTFADQTAKLSWMVAPQAQFTPFRGKLALFQKVFVDTDAYLHLGLGIVGVSQRANCGAATDQYSCSDPRSFVTLANTTKFTPTFGLGLNFYLTDFMSLGLEWRGVPFSWNRAGFDSHGSTINSGRSPDGKIDSRDDTFAFNQMISISLGFSLPAKPTISE